MQVVTRVSEAEHGTRDSACCMGTQFLISVPDGRLLIVLIQRLEECHQGGDVVGRQRDASKLDISVTESSSTRLIRNLDVKIDDVVQRIKLPIVHVGCRMSEVTEAG